MAYNKYKLYKKQISYDGVTWVDVTPSETACGGSPLGTYNTLEECEYAPITYYATSKLNVDLTKFTPTATAETFENGVGKIEFVENVTAIGQGVFSGKTAMTRIELPHSVTSIGGNAFYNCNCLTSITIPSGVTIIGAIAFQGCSSLTSVTCLATTPPAFGRIAPFGNTNECPIYVPSASLNAYKSASGWRTYESRIRPIT